MPYTIGLASSTTLVRSSEPTTRVVEAGLTELMPYAKLLEIAKSALLLEPI